MFLEHFLSLPSKAFEGELLANKRRQRCVGRDTFASNDSEIHDDFSKMVLLVFANKI